MQAYFTLALFVAIFAAMTVAQPHDGPSVLPAVIIEEEQIRKLPDTEIYEHPVEEEHSRQKRATCDLLGPLNLGNAPCAANCIRKGYRGGWCDSKAVCNCRR